MDERDCELTVRMEDSIVEKACYRRVKLVMYCVLTIAAMATGSAQVASRIYTPTSAFTDMDKNITHCPHQYPLSESTRARICTYKGDTQLDIRHFFDGHPTIKGITLTHQDYMTLDLLWESIKIKVQELEHHGP